MKFKITRSNNLIFYLDDPPKDASDLQVLPRDHPVASLKANKDRRAGNYYTDSGSTFKLVKSQLELLEKLKITGLRDLVSWLNQDLDKNVDKLYNSARCGEEKSVFYKIVRAIRDENPQFFDDNYSAPVLIEFDPISSVSIDGIDDVVKDIVDEKELSSEIQQAVDEFIRTKGKELILNAARAKAEKTLESLQNNMERVQRSLADLER